MNIFVVHSTKDRQEVERQIDEIKRKTYSLNVLLLENSNMFWHIDAKKKIKKAQAVLFFVGKDSYKSPYIGWELRCAKKLKKPIYTVFLDENNPYHSELDIRDAYTKIAERYDEVVSITKLTDILKGYQNKEYAIFNQTLEEMDMHLLLEQYKVFLQTSEDLVTRRQNVNNFYISLSSALFALLSALFAFDLEDAHRLIIGIGFCAVGFIFSSFWRKIIISYGNLNGSKMTIIQGIEKKLPASLFEAEWAVLSDRLNRKRYVSFTDSEKKIPIIFMCLYGLMGATMAFIGVMYYWC